MRIEDSALMSDIAMVTNNNPNPTHFRYDVTVRSEAGTALALKMESLSETRNYIQDYGDNSVLVAWFIEADYKAIIEPHLTNLELVLSKTQMGNVNASNAQSQYDGRTRWFKVSVMDVTIPDIGESNGPDRDTTNTLKRVTFQMFDRALYQLRMKTVSGIFRADTAESLLKTLLTGISKKVELDGAVKPAGVDMVPADTRLRADGSLNIRDNLIIRGGVALYDLAGYIQRHCGGIYNNGIGCYFTNLRWYVYPLYDNSRFGSTNRTLTILRVPAQSMPDIDHSYTLMDQHLVVLGTDEAVSIDNTNHNQLNKGNGAVYGTASGLFNPQGDAPVPGGFSSEADSMGRIVVSPRPDGLNSTRYNASVVTDNNALIVSELAANTQQILQFGWAYADTSLLYPGMPVRILYSNAGIVEKLEGTLIAGDSFTELATPGMATVHYQTKVSLTVLATKPPARKI